jgi:hypothetical protein
MVVVELVAAVSRHAEALTSLDRVIGRTTALPISMGDQVLSTHFVE